jgi:MFS transporter, FSR family, fosmidomycin resistance protein
MKSRVLKISCGAHAIHDGFTDLINVLLPLLQTQFALSYAAAGALKALYSAAMAAGQIPSSNLSHRIGAPIVLSCGTALAGLGYIVAGSTGIFAVVALGLLLAGLGASTQHPIASSLVSSAFEGKAVRTALGTYNAAGDLGKVLIPAVFAVLATYYGWQLSLVLTGLIGLVGAIVIRSMLAKVQAQPQEASAKKLPSGKDVPWAFKTLFGIHLLDNTVRTGFQVFLPFLLLKNGATLPQVGLALSLLFAGGAGGKFIFGWVGSKLGVVATVALTAVSTSLLILVITFAPLNVMETFALIPVLGVVLAGTSSVLYGTIPEFVTEARRTHAFAIFYTGGSVAGALSPPALGLIGDGISLPYAFVAMALCALAMAPVTASLRSVLGDNDEAPVAAETGRP